ncbi:VWA domain-containing protein [Ideonella azotifigens]|uniref:VWFA domain-containing protein n=1 Tax=Ideonella azotifigens TaxID=513160 RepID=A0ABN1JZP0_9BURK|nr:vWA domain-containing protein [Ideonella azotifigens]MCD2342655.1 VWA domain-containing protein [Ideonella azotifigens]
MSFDQPLWLVLLPLALLPLFARTRGALPNAWVALLPRDRGSQLLHGLLRGAAVLALAAVVVGIAGPYRPEYEVERVGRGAEIVLVLDRSRSMDQSFGGGRKPSVSGTGPEALDYYAKLRANEARETKGVVARRVLSEFAAKRPDDRFGMIVFSTLPLRVLEFTQKSEVIQAAINAGNIGRGLSETNIGLALESALASFGDRPYTGSRIVMLVSDGGDRLDPGARDRIAQLARKTRAAIYWIYIRSARSPGLLPDQTEPPANADAVPEYFLHRYFLSLGTPYRPYEAGTPEALQQAIDDVNRLENLPITYQDTMPRRDLSGWGYAAALASVLLLLGANLLELRRWA